jgi:CRP/FNR family cyclic AMP-dependent transcriptional regulator
MLQRFQGVDGARLLKDALRQQKTLLCSEPVIDAIAAVAELAEAKPGDSIIIQGNDDNRLALLLSGKVDVLIGGVKVATRTAGQHVGEMSIIDPSARRSASVIATEHTCIAWIAEPAFSGIATAHPELWRTLALELSDRLRQRAASVRAKNERPIVFIGSSSESLTIAKSLDRHLSKDPVVVKRWNQGVFGASDATIESLEKICKEADFAILVLAADDLARIRGKASAVPRDNVIFELGMFTGAIGRARTLMMVEEKRPALRLPPDLEGVTYLKFSQQDATSRRKTISTCADTIRSRISRDGPK